MPNVRLGRLRRGRLLRGLRGFGDAPTAAAEQVLATMRTTSATVYTPQKQLNWHVPLAIGAAVIVAGLYLARD